MTTIKDISKACGVSPATVSKALNGYADISPETTALVKQKARELHYMPNAAARLLKTNISHSVGVLFVDDTMSGLTHEYFSQILNSVKEEAESRGYDITFICRKLGERNMSYLEHCRYRNCDGVVVACVDFQDPAVIELINSNVPVVTIDKSFDGVPSIMSDNYEGAYALTSNLADQGHSRIAFIHGEQTVVTQDRIKGYKQAMHDRGLEIVPGYIAEARYHDAESAGRATAGLMELPVPPTAIMYPDDYSFLGGQTELQKRGLEIPEDISVCGYDGIGLSRVLQPQLTTWYQDADRIGRESVKSLISLIEKRSVPETGQIMVSGKFLDGYSVKKRGV